MPPVTAARIPSRTGPSSAANGSGVAAGAGSAVYGARPAVPTARPSRGVTRFPVATAAVQRAFCSGVTCRSPWPMPRMTVDPPYHAPPFARTDSGVPR